MHRRLARDCETKPSPSESIIRLAVICALTQCTTGETTPTWQDE